MNPTNYAEARGSLAGSNALSATDARRPEVESWLSNLGSVIEENAKHVEELEQRYSAVLRPGDATGDAVGVNKELPQAMLCAVAGRIRDMCQQLDRQNGHLRSILERCEL